MFTFLGIPVRDTVVSTWVMMVLIVGIILIIRRLKPTALEMVVDFLADFISEIMRRPAEPFLPLIGSLALFIGVANMMGLVPVLKSPTSDINTTVALALVVFAAVHVYGVQIMGLGAYLKSLASPIFLLPLELVNQVSRTISLSVRLFGNVFSAEIIIAILFTLVPLIVPLPLQGFSIFTGLLQAYIFAALAAVYIAAGLPAQSDQTGQNGETESMERVDQALEMIRKE
jgi:F-type H+-transporting ATPase subunit a